MECKIEIEHENDGMKAYDDIKFEKARPRLLVVVNIYIIFMNIFPRIGEKLYADMPVEMCYKITDIIYYDDHIKINVNEEND